MTGYQWGQAALVAVAVSMLCWRPLSWAVRTAGMALAFWWGSRRGWREVGAQKARKPTIRRSGTVADGDPDWRD